MDNIFYTEMKNADLQSQYKIKMEINKVKFHLPRVLIFIFTGAISLCAL